VPGVVEHGARHLLGRQHAHRHARLAGGARHAVELRGLDVLHEHQAAGLVHVARAARAVAAAARQHDGDRARPALAGQGAEEDVDGQRELLLAIALAEQQAAPGDDHLLLGRDQVHVVGFHRHAVLDQANGHVRVAREQLVHQALEVG
jgi:hypothetical protein